MKKATLIANDNRWKNNNIFNPQGTLNRDNICHEWICLRKEFSLFNYDLSTHDINTPYESDFIIYSDMPNVLPNNDDINKSILILKESPLVKPDNYDENKHNHFHKIYTWDDRLVDGKKYIKYNYGHLFPNELNICSTHNKKLITTIAGNKTINHPLELYSERISAIKWFEKYHIEEFDLYGTGWNQSKILNPKIFRFLNKIPNFKKILAKTKGEYFHSYKGSVANKNSTLQNYKFTLCYENIKDIPGYVTEKIFDCFFAGSIPVYLGANNIGNYIPKNCFIDKREFKTYQDLYKHITSVSDKQISGYIQNISNYLKSEQAKQFKGAETAKIFVGNLIT